jgi:hypothetical protein
MYSAAKPVDTRTATEAPADAIGSVAALAAGSAAFSGR